MKHKHYDMIEEWARTGKQVQYMPIDYDQWLNLLGNKPPEWIDDCKYRFKPEVIKYKRYLIEKDGKPIIRVVNKEDEHYDPATICNGFRFVEYLDKDWQEYEI